MFAISAHACEVVDYFLLPLAEDVPNPELEALTLAYPDLRLIEDGALLSLENGTTQVSLAPPQINRRPSELLTAPTILDQFTYTYPLNFDLTAREVPWFDPGRIRNDDFFRMLYFSSAGAVRDSLVAVSLEPLSSAQVQVTTRRGVNCQLKAAKEQIAASGSDVTRFFEAPGGGFNWRNISGTERLSAHAFGIAVDLNPDLGGYWKWSGASEGAVGAYDPQIPEEVVGAFERYGFIWGGKWHHYDGMHFEYRPELILFSRLLEAS